MRGIADHQLVLDQTFKKTDTRLAAEKFEHYGFYIEHSKIGRQTVMLNGLKG